MLLSNKTYIIAVTLIAFLEVFICGPVRAEVGSLVSATFPSLDERGVRATSTLFMVEAPVVEGQAYAQLPLDNPEGAIVLALDEPSSRAFVLSDRLDSSEATDRRSLLRKAVGEDAQVLQSPGGSSFDLSQSPKGMLRVLLSEFANRARDKIRLLVAQPNSTLGLSAQVSRLSVRCGETVNVMATIEDEQTIVNPLSAPDGTPLRITAVIETPPTTAESSVTTAPRAGSTFALLDHGGSGDQAARDGIYTGTFTAPTVEGLQSIDIHITAEGELADGVPFRRDVVSSVMVVNAKSRLLREKITLDKGSLKAMLQPVSGTYQVEAIFGHGDRALAYSRETFTVNRGNPSVVLALPPEAKAADRVMVRLLNVDTLGLEDEIVLAMSQVRRNSAHNVPR